MTTLHLRESINRSPLRCAFLLTTLALVCFGLSPTARAVTPTPDGAYANFNTAEGGQALLNLNTAQGGGNTGLGFAALKFLTTGDNNTAVGVNTLLFTTTAIQNTGVGQGALQNNNGDFNTATGFQALFSNTTGTRNTATGFRALSSNTGPSGSGLNGDDNTANGVVALVNNTTGNDNTAVGLAALFNNQTGFLNTALGSVAGSVTTGNNNIDIGNQGVDAENNTIRIGTQVDTTDIFGIILPKHTATYIAGISGQSAIMGDAVFVTSDGKLGTVTAVSSARFKDEIKPMDKVSEAILALKPVTFRYKKEIDPKGLPQFGLVAEDVEKVNPDLVKRDGNGRPYTVRYDQVNAMLLNEFLKEHREVQELKKQVATLTAGLQKVSAQLELNKPAPQTVVNNQ